MSDENQSNPSPSSPSSLPSSSSTSTVSSLPSDHALSHHWTMHYNGQGVWPPAPLYEFSTVGEFWYIFNQSKSPSYLGSGSNYHCFKEKIQPEWEDKANKNGGKWTLTLAKKASDEKSLKQADQLWMITLLSMIGEMYGDDNDEVCGAVIAPRGKEFRLSMWIRTSNEEVVKKIGKRWKELLEIGNTIQFQLHDESIKSNASYRHNASSFIL